MNNSILSSALVCVLLLVGCATTKSSIVAENEDFIVLKVDESDSYVSLAEKYLGDTRYANVIQRYNPDVAAKTGNHIA
ncbi:hypothetical protein, partial [Paraglaciecola sp.]|uniref:hypothetical protein n=1 Tax=Paraglaciecola sp. TaxID=1920173 RepID=UPI003EFAC055